MTALQIDEAYDPSIHISPAASFRRILLSGNLA